MGFRPPGDIGGFTVGSDFTTELAVLATYDFQLVGGGAQADLGSSSLDQNDDDGGFLWGVWIHGPFVGFWF